MKIHEYQAIELMKAYGAPVSSSILVRSKEEAIAAASEFGRCVVKAQVHCGGRGKAGGVKLAQNPEEAGEIASKMLGLRLVTPQTSREGKLVRKLLICQAVDVKREFYLSITTDFENAGLMILVSAEGGTEIELTAKSHPELIKRIPLSLISGFRDYQALDACKALGLGEELQEEFKTILSSIAKLYADKDCSLIEINPLVETLDGHLLCLDAKINFDDNSLFRHPDIEAMRDIEEEDPKEYKASQYDLSYVSLDGDIGCLVNGAGLAMATMDIIKNFGGNPANFLDVGGSATTQKVKAAFEILLSDPNVKAIFVNIFGGIMKCDVIAQGVVEAANEIGLSIPLVVRLEGTNVALGREILETSGMAIISACDMADGARKAIAAAKGETL